MDLRFRRSAARTVPMGAWQVALAGPERVVGPVAAILGCVRLEEALPSLDVTIGRNGRARGTVRGEALWALALPQARWLPLLVGQIVAAATVLLRRHLFVHAGVVAIEGRGWVLIGGSGAGKTSTVAVLVREGAAYLSDEVALLDPERATVAPFTLPMAVKPWTLQAAGALPEGRDVATEGDTRFHLPDRRAEGPLPIAGLVVFDPARPAAPLTTAHRAETLMAMAEYPSTMRYRDRLEEAFPAFARLLRQVNCYALGAPGPEPITRAGLFGVLRRAAAAGSDR